MRSPTSHSGLVNPDDRLPDLKPMLPARSCRLAVIPSRHAAEEASEASYFCRGFVEDLITELSRFSTIDLISSHTTFAPELRALDDAAIAETLGADFLLKAGVRKRGEFLRLNTELIDAACASVLWAERFDTPLESVFTVQDALVEKISLALCKRVDRARLERARQKPFAKLEAYDCWLRGIDKLRQGDLAGDEEAREYFERALEIDPHYARAYVGLSVSHYNEWSCQHWELSEVSECRAFQYAQRALQLDGNDALCHVVLARVHLFRSEFERAETHLRRGYERNPNDADALVMMASGLTFLGKAEEGAALFERAMELNPFFEPWYFAYGTFIKIMNRRFAEAIEMGLKAPLTTVWIDLAALLALAHAYEGRREEAAAYRESFLATFQEKITGGREPDPGEAFDWLVLVNPFKGAEDKAFYRKGLQLAGLETARAGRAEVRRRSAAATPEASRPFFCARNGLRHIIFGAVQLQLPEVKGFKDIEQLITRPGDEIHCTELMGVVSESGESSEVMDARARSECASRIRELQSDLEEAEGNHDSFRAERIREELDPLIDHLAKAVGIGGRSRRLAAPSERARSAVTCRIRQAIKKLEAADPHTGRHFANSIRTGTFCSYRPEKPVAWTVEASEAAGTW